MLKSISRRQLLLQSTLGLAASQVSWKALAMPEQKPRDGSNHVEAADWRTWKITCKATPVAPTEGVVLPLPMQKDTTYQRSLGLSFRGNFAAAEHVRDAQYRADALLVTFNKDVKTPEIEVSMTVQTRDRSLPEPKTATEDLALYLKATPHMPVDGLVREYARKISKGKKSTRDKALAFYNWIVDNTVREASIRGCGIGDINALLQAKNIAGKCADLNALFVGFCRAVGIPAREVYGLRVGESAQFKAIGKTGLVSKAQHCRAEFYDDGQGWIGVDPADIRKIVLEEKLDLRDAKVQTARRRLFGYWEMNWIAYNTARDIQIPGFTRELNYLMYPHGFDPAIDSLDPDAFRYSIESANV